VEDVKVELGYFATCAMQARVGTDLAQGVREAVKHYSRRLESGRKPLALPPFLGSDDAPEEELALEVAIGPETEATLEREADRQHATPQQILRHAVLTYLADLDRDGRPLRFVDPPTV
jgi:hypothetical protein